MAISRVGSAGADTTSVTIPVGHQAGDLIVIFAFAATLVTPSLPAGWTNVIGSNAGASGQRTGWKIAGSSSEVSGTWTNATGVVCVVYRGVATNKLAASNAQFGAISATGTTVTYTGGASAILKCPGTSWIVAFAGIKSTTSTIETAPTNLTNFVDTVGAANEYVGHDSNGPYVPANWPSTNVSVGVSAEWQSGVPLEILAEQPNIENYKGFDVGNGMSTGEKIK